MALTLTGAAVRALNDEELKSAKDTLVARAASAGRTSPEKLSAQLVVAAGEWVPAYQLTIQGFMEVRSPRIEPKRLFTRLGPAFLFISWFFH